MPQRNVRTKFGQPNAGPSSLRLLPDRETVASGLQRLVVYRRALEIFCGSWQTGTRVPDIDASELLRRLNRQNRSSSDEQCRSVDKITDGDISMARGLLESVPASDLCDSFFVETPLQRPALAPPVSSALCQPKKARSKHHQTSRAIFDELMCIVSSFHFTLTDFFRF